MEPTMTTAPRAVLSRYYQAMLDKSADDLADLYAADAVHEFPFTAPGFPARFDGREQVRAGYHAAWDAAPMRLTAIEDVRVHETADPEVIVAEQRAVGTMGPEERAFAVPGLLILRVRDGEVVHVRDYMDALAVSGVAG
jgi:ketosteroid isomerase-like protein